MRERIIRIEGYSCRHCQHVSPTPCCEHCETEEEGRGIRALIKIKILRASYSDTNEDLEL